MSIFKKAPHFLKPVQVISAIAIIITVITIMYGDLDRMWQTALAALILSGASTVILALGIQHKLVQRYTCGLVSWNAIEFVYSLFLAYHCGTTAWWTWDEAEVDYNKVQYMICVVLFVILTISYVVSLLCIAREESVINRAEQQSVINKKEFTNDEKVFIENY